mmetsp:Transcript_22227/g.51120  ORF Transcript_22227/g.51120 Transcript_22227/m.51120 type:complete len:205 (-) Transcript_22227:294-908(-)
MAATGALLRHLAVHHRRARARAAPGRLLGFGQLTRGRRVRASGESGGLHRLAQAACPKRGQRAGGEREGAALRAAAARDGLRGAAVPALRSCLRRIRAAHRRLRHARRVYERRERAGRGAASLRALADEHTSRDVGEEQGDVVADAGARRRERATRAAAAVRAVRRFRLARGGPDEGVRGPLVLRPHDRDGRARVRSAAAARGG